MALCVKKNFDKGYILDTNILLEDANHIFHLSSDNENLIILPEVVLDELDSKKQGFEEINFQARAFARIFETATIVDLIKVDEYKIVCFQINEPRTIRVDVISKRVYDADGYNTSLNIYNDRKILEVAEFCQKQYGYDTIFLSLDSMARIRALSMNLKTDSLLGRKNKDFDRAFIKHIDIDFNQLEDLIGSSIYEYDPTFKAYNFSYCFHVNGSDQVVLTYIQQETICLLDESEVRDQMIIPLNKEQLFFSNAIIQPYYDILIIEAKAGSGKTLLALSGAFKLIRQKLYSRVVYIRNSIESLDKGEDVGYLPGLEEKFKIYNHPLMDSLDYIIRQEHKKKRQQKNREYTPLDDQEISMRLENFIQTYGIETMWVGEMRGRTISNAVVIVDEAQNMSNKTMQMVLSRVDNSCKVLVLGSNKQIDNFYVNKHTNALTTLLNATEYNSDLVNLFSIELKKVLRGPITQWAETVFSTHKDVK